MFFLLLDASLTVTGQADVPLVPLQLTGYFPMASQWVYNLQAATVAIRHLYS